MMRTLFILFTIAVNLCADNFEKAVENYNKGAYIKALDGFFALAKKGDDKAQYNVAMMYASGKGLKASHSEAMRWYEKAAKQDNADAQYNLAQLYHSMGDKDPHAYEKAKYWYEKAVENGIKQAYNNLASFYMDGKGVAKSEKKSFSTFQKGIKYG